MPDNLAAALVKLQADLPRIRKEAKGQHGKYADLATLTAILLPKLTELGCVWVTKPTLSMEFGPEPKFVLDYHLGHVESEDELSGSYPLGSGNPQQLGSAITYARRYCLCAVTGVAPDEDDDDGQAAVTEYKAMRNAPPEVDQYGAATFAEQTRMMTGPEPGTVRATAAAGEQTEWTVTPEPPEEDPRGPARRGMFALYRELGITDKEPMLADLTQILGRAIHSRDDLSLHELTMTVNPLLRSRRDDRRKQKSGKP